LNLKPSEYIRLTYREFELMSDGYQRRADTERELNLEAWRQARFVAFNSLKPHLKNQMLTITDFMPLPGDTESLAQHEKEADDVYRYYQDRGWLKQGEA
jgi:hypothetical protein